jgi:hypothetical protein
MGLGLGLPNLGGMTNMGMLQGGLSGLGNNAQGLRRGLGAGRRGRNNNAYRLGGASNVNRLRRLLPAGGNVGALQGSVIDHYFSYLLVNQPTLQKNHKGGLAKSRLE